MKFSQCLIFYVGALHATQVCRRVLNVNETTTAGWQTQDILWSNTDDFIITKRLGSGTFGEAFRGKNVTSNEQFVIKLYKFGKMKRRKMLREIAIVQRLCGHPNIIRLYHVIRQSLFGYPALVFESVHNVDHNELYPALSAVHIRHYAYQLLSGLAYAHNKGIMHKDIKPDNVMIDHEFGILKIIDWGISDFYKQGVEQNIAGSLHYKSPEMLMDYAYTSYSTDMWSYGCMLAAMLFKRHVMFEGTTERSQLHAIARVLGTKDLITYTNKYDMDFNISIISQELPRVPWETFVTEENNSTVTGVAIDLLDKILRYDHRDRITAQEALCHPYFASLRNTTVCSTLQNAVDQRSESLESQAPEVTAQTIYSIYYNASSSE